MTPRFPQPADSRVGAEPAAGDAGRRPAYAVRAVLRPPDDPDWNGARLQVQIAGLSLIERHLLGLRAAGVRDVEIAVPAHDPAVEKAVRGVEVPGIRLQLAIDGHLTGRDAIVIEQRADTLVDPRLVFEVVRWAVANAASAECVDRFAANYPPAAKSPFTGAAARAGDIREVDPAAETGLFAAGLSVTHPAAERPPARLHAGRRYWHRIAGATDASQATTKVFHATMKPTDGIYARTNRRVSIPISRILARTAVTPNQVTLVAFACSAVAGWLFAQGGYATMAAGSLVGWFASMLDGVDGELARAKFRATRFGAWLEMVCDYLYYVLVFAGMGVGVYRRTPDPLWILMGAGAVVGVILGFVAVARWKQRHFPHAGGGDSALAFQRTVEAGASNPVYAFLRRCAFLATRATLPYYIAIFALLDLIDLLIVIIFVGTHLTWMLVLYASRLPVQAVALTGAVDAPVEPPRPAHAGEAAPSQTGRRSMAPLRGEPS